MQNPLFDVMSPKARKWVYAILSLAVLAVGLWQATDGNWTVFLVQLASAVVHAMSNANTNPVDPQVILSPQPAPSSAEEQP